MPGGSAQDCPRAVARDIAADVDMYRMIAWRERKIGSIRRGDANLLCLRSSCRWSVAPRSAMLSTLAAAASHHRAE